MSFLGLVAHTGIASIAPRCDNEPVTAEQFVERLRGRVQELERTLSNSEELEVVVFLPSGKAILVETIGFENPNLVILQGREEETSKTCTLLAHQSSVQLLVSAEPIQSEASRKVLRFSLDKW
ncbi:hypothetical protein [Petrachloros mirabilis]